jgi:hypothetical protein
MQLTEKDVSVSAPPVTTIPEEISAAEIAEQSRKFWYQQQLVEPSESPEER